MQEVRLGFPKVTCCHQLSVAFLWEDRKHGECWGQVVIHLGLQCQNWVETLVVWVCVWLRSVLSSISQRNLWPFPPHRLPLPRSAYIQRRACPRAACVTITWPAVGTPHDNTASPVWNLNCFCRLVRTSQHTAELSGQLWPTVVLPHYSISPFPSLSCSYTGTMWLILAKGLWEEVVCVTSSGKQ